MPCDEVPWRAWRSVAWAFFLRTGRRGPEICRSSSGAASPSGCTSSQKMMDSSYAMAGHAGTPRAAAASRSAIRLPS